MKEYRPFQSPLEMTQSEVEGMKAEQKKVMEVVNARIKRPESLHEKEKSSMHDKHQNIKDTPVELSKKDLALLKMEGEISENLRKEILVRTSTYEENKTPTIKEINFKSSPQFSPPKT